MRKKVQFFFAFLFFHFFCSAQELLPLGNGLRVTGAVYAIEFDSLTGRTFIGGYFTQVEDVRANNIAWHDALGWHAFGSGTDGYIAALKFADGKLFAAGNFTSIDGVALSCIGSWDGNSWQQLATGISGGIIRSMEWYDSSLYISGYFVYAGNQLANNVARWDGQAWHAVGSGANNYYVYLTLLEDTLYAYGNFTVFNGDTTSLVKLNGTTWQPLTNDTLNLVQALTKKNDTLFAITYQLINSYYRNVSHIQAGVWTGLVHNIGFGSNQILFSFHDTLFYSTSQNGYDELRIYCISDTTPILSALSIMGQHTYYEPQSVKIYGNSVYVTGFFNNLNNTFSTGLARYDGTAWTAPFFVSLPYYDAWYYGWGRNLMYDSTTNELLVSGKFYFAGDTLSPSVAKWDGSSWHAMGAGLNGGDDGEVRRMLIFKDTLYACGSFTRSGNQPLRGIAKWNGTFWLPVGGICNGTVKSMDVYHDTLYVIGEFDTIGNIAAEFIAKYDGGSWHPVPEVHSSASNQFKSLCSAYGNLYLAGSYFNVGTNSNIYFAKYDGASWTLPPFFFQDIRTLKLLGDSMYATRESSSAVYKYNGLNWFGNGYPSQLNSYAYPSILLNRFVVADWSKNTTFIKDGTAWPELMYKIVLDCVDRDASSGYVTGFIPSAYPSQRLINHIGIVIKQAPVASFNYDRDSICDHEYIFFSAASSDLFQQYDWTFQGASTSHFIVQNPIAHYINAGDFDVHFKVTNVFGSDSISLLSLIHVENCTATLINETTETEIEIYPNPFTDELHLKGKYNISLIKLTDLTGKTLISKYYDEAGTHTEDRISMEVVAPGIYLLNVQLPIGNVSFKVIKL